MQFEWDDQERKTNIRKHGPDFRDAWKLFDFPMLVAADDRYDYEEDRWIGMPEGRTLVVIFTERGDDTMLSVVIICAFLSFRTDVRNPKISPSGRNDRELHLVMLVSIKKGEKQ